VPSIFERLNRARPSPGGEEAKPDPKEQAKVLLAWLDRWPKPVLTLTDLRNYSPRAIRKKEIALRSAQILTAHGHLTRVNSYTWNIIRENLSTTDSR
jgi:hypothetical protein